MLINILENANNHAKLIIHVLNAIQDVKLVLVIKQILV